MPKKIGTTNKHVDYEFLNKHELKDLRNRDEWYRRRETYDRPDFECDCGCTELDVLRDGFGQCPKCKLPYILTDIRRTKTKGAWVQAN